MQHVASQSKPCHTHGNDFLTMSPDDDDAEYPSPAFDWPCFCRRRRLDPQSAPACCAEAQADCAKVFPLHCCSHALLGSTTNTSKIVRLTKPELSSTRSSCSSSLLVLLLY